MRSDRLLSILLLLQVNQRMTARQLAQRFEVSERTILRDMDALSASGVPVYAERGSGGGWELLEEYRTNLTGLNLTEIQALFLRTPARLLADLGLTQASETGFTKLLAALPTMQQREIAQISAGCRRLGKSGDATGCRRKCVQLCPELWPAHRSVSATIVAHSGNSVGQGTACSVSSGGRVGLALIPSNTTADSENNR